MPVLNQSELPHQAGIFVVNGARPEPQSVINRIGYGPVGLNVGRLFIQQFLDDKSKTHVLQSVQKQATEAQEQARRVAHIELNILKQTTRLLFKGNSPVLTSLGLLPHHSSVSAGKAAAAGGEAEPGSGTSQPHPKTTTTLAEDVARWTLLLTNLSTLTEAQQAELAQAGWDAERIAAATALIEACATADTVQKQRVQEYLAQSAVAKAAEAALRKWYNQAVRLCKLAIKQADPTNQGRLLELLGFQ